MMNTNWIFFDLDGCLVDLYSVEGWLDMLIAEDPTPYIIAKPLVNMNTLARKLNKLQRAGYKLGVISWMSKGSTESYDAKVAKAKLDWLGKHLRSVNWDTIHIVPYGRNKWEICGAGILFDDEEPNRANWHGDGAFHPSDMMEILSSLAA